MRWTPRRTANIEEQDDLIYKALNEIKQVIEDLKSLLETGDVGLVIKYRSRIAKFRKLPPKFTFWPMNLLPQSINREELLNQFGSFCDLSAETEEQGYTVPSSGAESSPQDRPLLDVPRFITDIPIGHINVHDVSCLSDLKGKLLRSV